MFGFKKINSSLSNLLIVSVLLSTIACGGGGAPGKNVAPIISVNAPASADEGTEISLTVVADDPDGTVRQVQWTKTYGPTIDFGGTEKRRTVTFELPLVEEDTALGLLVEVVDDDGAVAQEFIEIIITNTMTLKSVKVIKPSIEHNNFQVELAFSSEVLKNTVIDYSNFCQGNIIIRSKNNKVCTPFNIVPFSNEKLVLIIDKNRIAELSELEISSNLKSVYGENAKSFKVLTLLDKDYIDDLNFRLSKY